MRPAVMRFNSAGFPRRGHASSASGAVPLWKRTTIPSGSGTSRYQPKWPSASCVWGMPRRSRRSAHRSSWSRSATPRPSTANPRSTAARDGSWWSPTTSPSGWRSTTPTSPCSSSRSKTGTKPRTVMYQSRLLQASLTGMRTWCRPVMGGNASSTTLPVGTPEGLSTDPSLPITLELAEHQGGKRLGYSPFQNRSHPRPSDATCEGLWWLAPIPERGAFERLECSRPVEVDERIELICETSSEMVTTAFGLRSANDPDRPFQADGEDIVHVGLPRVYPKSGYSASMKEGLMAIGETWGADALPLGRANPVRRSGDCALVCAETRHQQPSDHDADTRRRARLSSTSWATTSKPMARLKRCLPNDGTLWLSPCQTTEWPPAGDCRVGRR